MVLRELSEGPLDWRSDVDVREEERERIGGVDPVTQAEAAPEVPEAPEEEEPKYGWLRKAASGVPGIVYGAVGPGLVDIAQYTGAMPTGGGLDLEYNYYTPKNFYGKLDRDPVRSTFLRAYAQKHGAEAARELDDKDKEFAKNQTVAPPEIMQELQMGMRVPTPDNKEDKDWLVDMLGLYINEGFQHTPMYKADPEFWEILRNKDSRLLGDMVGLYDRSSELRRKAEYPEHSSVLEGYQGFVEHANELIARDAGWWEGFTSDFNAMGAGTIEFLKTGFGFGEDGEELTPWQSSVKMGRHLSGGLFGALMASMEPDRGDWKVPFTDMPPPAILRKPMIALALLGPKLIKFAKAKAGSALARRVRQFRLKDKAFDRLMDGFERGERAYPKASELPPGVRYGRPLRALEKATGIPGKLGALGELPLAPILSAGLLGKEAIKVRGPKKVLKGDNRHPAFGEPIPGGYRGMRLGDAASSALRGVGFWVWTGVPEMGLVHPGLRIANASLRNIPRYSAAVDSMQKFFQRTWADVRDDTVTGDRADYYKMKIADAARIMRVGEKLSRARDIREVRGGELRQEWGPLRAVRHRSQLVPGEATLGAEVLQDIKAGEIQNVQLVPEIEAIEAPSRGPAKPAAAEPVVDAPPGTPPLRGEPRREALSLTDIREAYKKADIERRSAPGRARERLIGPTEATPSSRVKFNYRYGDKPGETVNLISPEAAQARANLRMAEEMYDTAKIFIDQFSKDIAKLEKEKADALGKLEERHPNSFTIRKINTEIAYLEGQRAAVGEALFEVLDGMGRKGEYASVLGAEKLRTTRYKGLGKEERSRLIEESFPGEARGDIYAMKDLIREAADLVLEKKNEAFAPAIRELVDNLNNKFNRDVVSRARQSNVDPDTGLLRPSFTVEGEIINGTPLAGLLKEGAAQERVAPTGQYARVKSRPFREEKEYLYHHEDLATEVDVSTESGMTVERGNPNWISPEDFAAQTLTKEIAREQAGLKWDEPLPDTGTKEGRAYQQKYQEYRAALGELALSELKDTAEGMGISLPEGMRRGFGEGVVDQAGRPVLVETVGAPGRTIKMDVGIEGGYRAETAINQAKQRGQLIELLARKGASEAARGVRTKAVGPKATWGQKEWGEKAAPEPKVAKPEPTQPLREPRKPVKQEVKIGPNRDGGFYKREGLVIGSWAVHKGQFGKKGDPQWTVTHLPSGLMHPLDIDIPLLRKNKYPDRWLKKEAINFIKELDRHGFGDIKTQAEAIAVHRRGGFDRLGTEPVATSRVSRQKRISRKDLKANPDTIYLFGDNLKREGFGGQAKAMRGEPNARGIPTKKTPSRAEEAYFTDAEFAKNKAAIDTAFNRIPANKDIVIPADGLGTGLAQLQRRAPKTFEYLQKKLAELETPKGQIKAKPPAPKPERVSQPGDTVVHWGKNQNTVLSNFAETPFEYMATMYKTAEGAYQAFKSGDNTGTARRQTPGYENLTGHQAKAKAKKDGVRTHTKSNLALMEEILREKYEQVPEFAKALDSAGRITHPVADTFWAENFPKVLERVRRRPRVEPAPEGTPLLETAQAKQLRINRELLGPAKKALAKAETELRLREATTTPAAMAKATFPSRKARTAKLKVAREAVASAKKHLQEIAARAKEPAYLGEPVPRRAIETKDPPRAPKVTKPKTNKVGYYQDKFNTLIDQSSHRRVGKDLYNLMRRLVIEPEEAVPWSVKEKMLKSSLQGNVIPDGLGAAKAKGAPARTTDPTRYRNAREEIKGMLRGEVSREAFAVKQPTHREFSAEVGKDVTRIEEAWDKGDITPDERAASLQSLRDQIVEDIAEAFREQVDPRKKPQTRTGLEGFRRQQMKGKGKKRVPLKGTTRSVVGRYAVRRVDEMSNSVVVPITMKGKGWTFRRLQERKGRRRAGEEGLTNIEVIRADMLREVRPLLDTVTFALDHARMENMVTKGTIENRLMAAGNKILGGEKATGVTPGFIRTTTKIRNAYRKGVHVETLRRSVKRGEFSRPEKFVLDMIIDELQASEANLFKGINKTFPARKALSAELAAEIKNTSPDVPSLQGSIEAGSSGRITPPKITTRIRMRRKYPSVADVLMPDWLKKDLYREEIKLRKLGLSPSETEAFIGHVGDAFNNGHSLLASGLAKEITIEGMIPQIELQMGRALTKKEIKAFRKVATDYLSQFDQAFEGHPAMADHSTQINYESPDILASSIIRKIPSLFEVTGVKEAVLASLNPVKTFFKELGRLKRADKNKYHLLQDEAYQMIASKWSAKAKRMVISNMVRAEMNRIGISISSTREQAADRLAINRLLYQDSLAIGLPSRLTRLVKEVVGEESVDILHLETVTAKEIATAIRTRPDQVLEAINKELVSRERKPLTTKQEKELFGERRKEEPAQAGSQLSDLANRIAEYENPLDVKAGEGVAAYDAMRRAFAFDDTPADVPGLRNMEGAFVEPDIQGAKVGLVERTIQEHKYRTGTDAYLHPDWLESVAFESLLQEQLANSQFSAPAISFMKGNVTFGAILTHLGNTMSHSLAAALYRGQGPISLYNDIAMTAYMFNKWKNQGKRAKVLEAAEKSRPLQETVDAFEALDSYANLQTLDFISAEGVSKLYRSKRGGVAKTWGVVEAFRRKLYQLEDNAPRLYEAIYEYKGITKELAALKDGEFLEIQTSRHGYHVVRKAKGQFWRGKGAAMQREQLRQLKASAAMWRVKGRIVDYTDVARFIKAARVGKLGALSAFISPFVSFPYLVIDVPGAKKGIVGATLVDGMFTDKGATNSPSILGLRAKKQALRSMRVAMFGLAVSGFDHPDAEDIRPLARFSREPGTLTTSLVRSSPNHNVISVWRWNNANAFEASLLFASNIMAAQAWIADRVKKALPWRKEDSKSDNKTMRFFQRKIAEGQVLSVKDLERISVMTGNLWLKPALKLMTEGSAMDKGWGDLPAAIDGLMSALIGTDNYAIGKTIAALTGTVGPKHQFSAFRPMINDLERTDQLKFEDLSVDQQWDFMISHAVEGITRIYMRDRKILENAADVNMSTRHIIQGLRSGLIEPINNRIKESVNKEEMARLQALKSHALGAIARYADAQRNFYLQLTKVEDYRGLYSGKRLAKDKVYQYELSRLRGERLQRTQVQRRTMAARKKILQDLKSAGK